MPGRLPVARTTGVLALALFAACGSGGGFPDAPRAIDAAAPGTFAVMWTIDDASMQPVTCMQASATTVMVSFHETTTGAAYGQPFSCTLGLANSGAIPIGHYDFKFTLLSGSTQIATAPDQTNIAIQPAQTAQLAPLLFVLQ